MPDVATKTREVLRLLNRYIVEIIEEYDICPWARQARLRGEIATEVVWGSPQLEDWIECSLALLSRPAVRIAMIVAPQFEGTASEFQQLRDVVASRVVSAGVADFHPNAAQDFSTPPRLVPYLRRSPHPMLQLIPIAALEQARGRSHPVPVRSAQVRMLGGLAAPQPRAVADRVAELNFERVRRDRERIAAAIADIHADRDLSCGRFSTR